MKEYLVVLLPIGWALVATGIAMVLYKSSDSLFEEKTRNQAKTRRIRLTGSVVIAAIAFIGMAQATPEHALATDRPDEVRVNAVELRSLSDRIESLEDNLVELEGCVAVSVPRNCLPQVEAVRAATRNVTEARARVVPIAPL